MMVSDDQRTFIDLCVFKHGGHVERARTECGILPAELRSWYETPEFDAEMQRMSYVKLRMAGLDIFRLVDKLMLIINSDIADLADVHSIDDLRTLGEAVSYPVQSVKKMYDKEGDLQSLELKQHDKLKAVLNVLDKVLPRIKDAASEIGGGTADKRLDGVNLVMSDRMQEKLLDRARDRGQIVDAEVIPDDGEMTDEEFEALLSDE